jgi:hypothetical protein
MGGLPRTTTTSRVFQVETLGEARVGGVTCGLGEKAMGQERAMTADGAWMVQVGAKEEQNSSPSRYLNQGRYCTISVR